MVEHVNIKSLRMEQYQRLVYVQLISAAIDVNRAHQSNVITAVFVMKKMINIAVDVQKIAILVNIVRLIDAEIIVMVMEGVLLVNWDRLVNAMKVLVVISVNMIEDLVKIVQLCFQIVT